MRDTLVHRGPDDAGLLETPGLVLGSRRLAVRDPGPEGRQPMRTGDGRHALAYNGELYNDDELRADLEREGHPIEHGADTGVLLASLRAWGVDAIERLRGMYALAWADFGARTLTLARDPLGIKPLYWWTGSTRSGATLVFGSEPIAVLAHPDISARPDPIGVSNYLTTIRTVVEERTLFEGVRAVRPGETLGFALDAEPTASKARTRSFAFVAADVAADVASDPS
ncbi:MAG: asparagine synthetase B, partial [Planctomycetota bacterium]